jgi:hypothetical protein
MAAETTTDTKEMTMTDRHDPPAGHRDQLRALLARASEFTAALDEITHDDNRRLLDVGAQLVTWHAQLATVLLGIVRTPEAERGVTLAGALTATAEAAPAGKGKPPSKWEMAARLFEQPADDPGEA